MNTVNQKELEFLIASAAEKTNLLRIHPALEKDFYVTRVIHTLAEVKHELQDLIFVGGTSLAKAHRLVMRMSEDCDFRIRQKQAFHNLSTSQQRIQLKAFHQAIFDCLKQIGLTPTDDKIRISNNGGYLCFDLPYHSIYPASYTLKPHLKVEFITVDPKLQTEKKPVTTLIRNILGDEVLHEEKLIEVMNVTETSIDKWVALTRRVANSLRREPLPSDNDLVRHIYDLYYITKHGYIDDTLYPMIHQTIEEDITRYKNHSTDYYNDPMTEIKKALHHLKYDTIWHERWDNFNQSMVLSPDKLSYEEALHSLTLMSEPILEYLAHVPIKKVDREHLIPHNIEKTFWQQSKVVSELQMLSQHENPDIKRLIKLHHQGKEKDFTPNLVTRLNKALMQLAGNKTIARVLAAVAPTLYEKTKTLQQTLDNDHGLSQ